MFPENKLSLNNRNLDGYFTLEASFLLPMIIFLYLFLIYTAFFLYDRCLLAQDAYLISFRGSMFTDWQDGYGEVIYGHIQERNPDRIRNYMEQRSLQKNGTGELTKKYPALQISKELIDIDEANVRIHIAGTIKIALWQEREVEAKVQAIIYNPITIIRTVRREM